MISAEELRAAQAKVTDGAECKNCGALFRRSRTSRSYCQTCRSDPETMRQIKNDRNMAYRKTDRARYLTREATSARRRRREATLTEAALLEERMAAAAKKEDMHKWWLDRYTITEICDLAQGLWGDE